jgi:hypothetical protein
VDATKKKSCRESQKKGAFSRKPLAEPWTQTLPIGNDFHKIQQADLFSYDKSQQNADQSKVWEKALPPAQSQTPHLHSASPTAPSSYTLVFSEG